jgi:hypothetical protein
MHFGTSFVQTMVAKPDIVQPIITTYRVNRGVSMSRGAGLRAAALAATISAGLTGSVVAGAEWPDVPPKGSL